jgi:hypothetical protein
MENSTGKMILNLRTAHFVKCIQYKLDWSVETLCRDYINSLDQSILL